MIRVTVDNLSMTNVGLMVLLKSEEAGNGGKLPIYIGPPEAQAILFCLKEVELPRPMTHDLLKNVLDALEGRLEKIEVCSLKEGVFYAKLIVSFEGRTLEIDSRPSDAIALALRCNAPIYVAEEVMAEGAAVLEEDNGKATTSEPDTVEDPLAKQKAALVRAIKEERYEDAARLRDEIKQATSPN